MNGDKRDIDATFESIISGLAWTPDVDADREAPPVVELSDAELLREFQWLRVELVERRELVHPSSQEGRDLHARRAACQLELRQRGVISRAAHPQALAVTAPDLVTARKLVTDWLRDEVAAHEIDEVIHLAADPERFQHEIREGMRIRTSALRRWMSFVDPIRSGDDRSEVHSLHRDWNSMLDRLWDEGEVDVDSALGVGLELASAVDLLCGEYGDYVGFYDVYASTGWPEFVLGRGEDEPAHQWIFLVRVR